MANILAASPRFDAAVLIGRMQFYHNGHAQLLRAALDNANKVIIVLGSAFRARSAKNPFTTDERAAMIGVTLSAEDRARVVFAPVRDYADDVRWNAAVRRSVALHTQPRDSLALVRHRKDASSYYLENFPEWSPLDVRAKWNIDATGLRAALFEAEDLDVAFTALAGSAPTATLRYLKAWACLGHLERLAAEHKAILTDRKAWAAAPYPPKHVTVDALVRAGERVLLVRRKGPLGEGLWAMPGGHLEPDERLRAGALRELTEETQIAETESVLRDALRSVTVLDDPNRSLRGRTLTHVHYFVLPPGRTPAVEPSSDANAAEWIDISALPGMEDQCFEDHFLAMDQILQLGIIRDTAEASAK